MSRRWLSFLDEKTRARQGRTGTDRGSDAPIYVPFGQGKLERGDGVYSVVVSLASATRKPPRLRVLPK